MKIWIFQGNPDDYDIDGAIRDLDRIDWYAPVQQGAGQVRRGHIALMWRSSGRKTKAVPGIVGVGRVLERPKMRPIDPKEGQYIKSPDRFSEVANRAPLSLSPVDLVPKELVKAIPELEDHLLFRRPNGTLFEVSLDQWAALSAIVPEPPELDEEAGGVAKATDPPDSTGSEPYFRDIGDPSIEPTTFTTVVYDKETRRDEDDLLRRYMAWLGRPLRRYVIQAPDTAGELEADAFDKDLGLLIEAKASADRAHVRMAIGQLFDYRRFFPDTRATAILVPERPSDDLVDLISGVGIGLIYEEAKGDFVERYLDSPAG